MRGPKVLRDAGEQGGTDQCDGLRPGPCYRVGSIRARFSLWGATVGERKQRGERLRHLLVGSDSCAELHVADSAEHTQPAGLDQSVVIDDKNY
jgi:hypothetical protein